MTLSLTACDLNFIKKNKEKPDKETTEVQEETTSSSNSYSSLEEYMAKNPNEMDTLNSEGEEKGVEIKIDGNTLYYIYDLSQTDIDEEKAKSTEIQTLLQESVDKQKPIYTRIAKTIEDSTGLNGVIVVLRYTYNDETIIEQTFTSAGE